LGLLVLNLYLYTNINQLNHMSKIKCIVVDTVNGIQDAEYSDEKQKPNFDKWRD